MKASVPRRKASVPRRRPKYKNQETVGSDGFRYDSKKECLRFEQLRLRLKAGDIRLLMCQVPFRIDGGTKLVLDFVWIDNDGVMHFEDVKSPVTEKLASFRAKKRQVEFQHDINIDIVY
jgi:hypothetical protein